MTNSGILYNTLAFVVSYTIALIVATGFNLAPVWSVCVGGIGCLVFCFICLEGSL